MTEVRTDRRSTLVTLWRLAGPGRASVLALAGLFSGGLIAGGLSAHLLSALIEAVRADSVNPPLAAASVGAVLLAGGCTLGVRLVSARTARDASDRVTTALFRRMVAEAPDRIERHDGSGRVHALLTRAVNETGSLAHTVLLMLTGAIGVLMAVTGLLVISPAWMLLTAPPIGVACVFMGAIGRRVRLILEQVAAANERQLRVIGEVFDEEAERAHFVHAHALGSEFTGRFDNATRAHSAAIWRRDRLRSTFTELLHTGATLTMTVAVTALGSGSVGDRVAFALALSTMWTALAGLTDAMAHSMGIWIAVREGVEILADEPPARHARPAQLADATVNVVKASRSYGATVALDRATFALRPGENHVWVGDNAAGKSTATRLAFGTATPDEGPAAATLGGAPVARLSRDTVARRIGYVGASPPRFSGTVRSNLTLIARTLRRRHVDDAAVLWSCDVVGYTGALDADAGDLSTGTWVRVAIARALLAGCTVLIVDEAIKHLSPTARRRIRGRLRSLCRERGMTFVEITHEVPTYDQDTKIAVFSAGEIVAQGTHADLAGSNEVYRRLIEDTAAS